MILIFIAFAIAGVAALVIMNMNVNAAEAAKNWPTTNGVVVESGIGGNGEDGYRAVVVYEYDVGRGHYQGDRITLSGSSFSSQSKAQTFISNYPVGQAVVVHYDPNNPQSSVLFPEMNKAEIEGLAIFGYAAVFIGAIGATLGYLFKDKMFDKKE